MTSHFNFLVQLHKFAIIIKLKKALPLVVLLEILILLHAIVVIGPVEKIIKFTKLHLISAAFVLLLYSIFIYIYFIFLIGCGGFLK